MKNVVAILIILLFSSGILPLFSTNIYAQEEENPVTETKTLTDQEMQAEKIFNEGLQLYIKRQFGQAAEKWKLVIEMIPSHKKAQLYFERASDRYTRMQETYYTGLSHYKNNECKEAIANLKETLSINPRHEGALKFLPMAYEMCKIYISVEDKPDGKGNKIKDIDIPADGILYLYAVGYSGNNKLIGPINVIWETTGKLDKLKTTEPTSEFRFAPKTPGTAGTIKAYFTNLIAYETGTVKVKGREVASVKIMAIISNEKRQLKNLSMTADDQIKLTAEGYDKNGVFVNNVLCAWKIVNNKDVNENANTEIYNFSPTKANTTYKISASTPSGFTYESGNISVSPGKLKYVRIENMAGGTGKEVIDYDMTTDDLLKLYAAGYDKNDNYIADIDSDWESTGKIQFPRKTGKNIEFKSKSGNIDGTFKASKKGIIGDETGKISVRFGEVAYILITDQNNKEIKNIDMTIDDQIQVFVSGFTKEKEFVKKCESTWTVPEGFKPALVASDSLYLSADKANIIGTVKAVYKNFEASINVKTKLGGVASVKILELPSKEPLGSKELKIGDKFKIVAMGYDKEGNVIGRVEVNWEVTGNLNNLAYNVCRTNEFKAFEGDKSGTIKISHSKGGIFESGIIVVLKPVVITTKIQSENEVIYYVYNADVLSSIIDRVFTLKKPWKILGNYVTAVSRYNMMENPDLIYPKQMIRFPVIIVKGNETLKDIASKYLGDESKMNLLKIYNSGMNREVKEGDKVLLKDPVFLETGKTEVIKEEFKRPESLPSTGNITNNQPPVGPSVNKSKGGK